MRNSQKKRNQPQKRANQVQRREAAKRSVVVAPRSSASQPELLAALRWQEAPAAKREALESLDGYSHTRNQLRKLAQSRGEWAGYPMPLEDARLVIEPTYPMADALMAIGKPDALPDDEDSGAVVRNSFWCWHRKQHLVIWEKDGKIDYGFQGRVNQGTMLLDTLAVCDAWGIEQESNAVHTLGGMLRHRQFKQYLMCGMFMERSQRSGVSYLFRKLRPTLALKHGPKGLRILAALCLHPIGYYAGSWSGAMCPTDDVIAHLALMRGDEHMFWRRSNQHPSWAPEAGL